MLDTGYWLLVTGYWMLVTGCWILGARCWMLDAGYWMLDTGCWILDAKKYQTNQHRVSNNDLLVKQIFHINILPFGFGYNKYLFAF